MKALHTSARLRRTKTDLVIQKNVRLLICSMRLNRVPDIKTLMELAVLHQEYWKKMHYIFCHGMDLLLSRHYQCSEG